MSIKKLPYTGIDNLFNFTTAYLSSGKKVGVLANQSSVTKDFIPSAYALRTHLNQRLTCLFSPEHGWSAFNKEGIDIDNTIEPRFKIPIYSLYGKEFKNSLKQLESLDTLIVDLQDVGVRCYTYAASCAKLVKYASEKQLDIKFIICDRPNPLGDHITGFKYHPHYHSLVNYFNVPFVHGQTIGTMIKKFNTSLPNSVNLTVVNHSESYDINHHLWIPPSPGLVNWNTVLLYPGLVMLEGTNVSEGRGSTLPFEVVAAPGLDSEFLCDVIKSNFSGIVATRPFTFTPINGKLKNQECSGIQLHILDYKRLNSFYLGLVILCALKQSYNNFEWLFMNGDYWIDRLTSSNDFRQAIDEGESAQDIYNALKSTS